MLATVDKKKKYSIITYGCQMNFSDSEVVSSILNSNGYQSSDNYINSDLILLNTCSIREKAEITIRKKLESFKKLKKKNSNLKIGVLGCMAERLKEKFLIEEKIVDLVVGPDAYRDIPNLLEEVEIGNNAVNVILSKDETYDNIDPSRLDSNGISAFVSITRGCDNMCTFCVVPFTRGPEYSRPFKKILEEAENLSENGVREITLLGQNVNAYNYENYRLSDLILEIEKLDGIKRIRYTTSHPRDMTEDLINVYGISKKLMPLVHLPVQSGSDKILNSMNRKHPVSYTHLTLPTRP